MFHLQVLFMKQHLKKLKEPEVTQPVVKEEKEPVIIKETVSMVDSSPQLDKIVLQLENLQIY